MVVDQEDSGHPESPPAPEPVETVQPPKEWSQLHDGGIGQSIAKHEMRKKPFKSQQDVCQYTWYIMILYSYDIMIFKERPRGPEAQKVPKNTAIVPFTPKAGIRKFIMGALIVNTCRPLIFGTSPCLMKIEWPGCLEWSGYDGDSDGLCKGVSKGSPRRHSVNMAKRGVPGSVEALVCRASLHGSWVNMR